MSDNTHKQQEVHGGIRLLILNVVTGTATIVFTIALLLSTNAINAELQAIQQANDRYVACEMALNDLLETSTYLTTQSRLFATTSHSAYIDKYFWRLSINDYREADAELVIENFPGSNAASYAKDALMASDKLSDNELYAMKLLVAALNLKVDDEIAALLDSIAFTHGDETLSNGDMADKALLLMTYEPYEHDVERVSQEIEHCKDALAETLDADKKYHEEKLNGLYVRQQVLTVILLVMVLVTTVAFILAIARPLHEYVRRIDRGERLEEKGAYELRFLARSYNDMYEDNERVRKHLTFAAEHDALTGLLNRGACEHMIIENRNSPMTMVIIDVDHFKEVNDQYGHNVGDLVLQEVATALTESFEPEGTPFRLGGDEFVVLLPGTADKLRDVVLRGARRVYDKLIVAHDDIPSIAISAGAALGDGTQVSGELYKLADQALYRVKDEGRRGLAFHNEDTIISFEN